MIIRGIYVDYPPGQRRVRIGNWVHVRDNPTGKGQWFWDPKNNPQKFAIKELGGKKDDGNMDRKTCG